MILLLVEYGLSCLVALDPVDAHNLDILMEKSGLLDYEVKDTVLYRRIGDAHRKHVVRAAA